MQGHNSDPSFWFLLPPDTQPTACLRRSNIVAIAVLAFFILGMLVAGFVHSSGGTLLPNAGPALATGKHQPKIGSPAPPLHHVR
jgi:hypothetical protein